MRATLLLFATFLSFQCFAYLNGTITNLPSHHGIVPLLDLECTGAKIGPRRFLTAAHCLANRGPFPLYIQGQTFNMLISKGDKLVHFQSKVTNMKIHESYMGQISQIYDPDIVVATPGVFDLAVIDIADNSPIPYLPISSAKLKNKDLVFVGGFGCQSNNDDIILRFKTKNLSYSMARKKIQQTSNLKKFVNNVFYSNADNEFLSTGCEGDSGGPVLVDFNGLSIVGVNSYVDQKNQLNFTDLSSASIQSWLRN